MTSISDEMVEAALRAQRPDLYDQAGELKRPFDMTNLRAEVRRGLEAVGLGQRILIGAPPKLSDLLAEAARRAAVMETQSPGSALRVAQEQRSHLAKQLDVLRDGLAGLIRDFLGDSEGLPDFDDWSTWATEERFRLLRETLESDQSHGSEALREHLRIIFQCVCGDQGSTPDDPRQARVAVVDRYNETVSRVRELAKALDVEAGHVQRLECELREARAEKDTALSDRDFVRGLLQELYDAALRPGEEPRRGWIRDAWEARAARIRVEIDRAKDRPSGPEAVLDEAIAAFHKLFPPRR